jgi:hypothetical protein
MGNIDIRIGKEQRVMSVTASEAKEITNNNNPFTIYIDFADARIKKAAQSGASSVHWSLAELSATVGIIDKVADALRGRGFSVEIDNRDGVFEVSW